MLPNIGVTEGLILAFIVLLLFGAKRLPEIGGSLGKGIREFKSSVKDIQTDVRAVRGELEDSNTEENTDREEPDYPRPESGA
ncbi:MAG: twin-arginine translocase TatA/TatE family subunit [Gemmatimonadota bacterium]